MHWSERLPACFADFKFAKEETERELAKTAMREAADDGITKEEFKKEVLWYLYESDVQMMKDRMDIAVKAIDKLWKD